MSPIKARKGRDQVIKQDKTQRFLNFCTILTEDKDFLALYINRIIFDAHVFTTTQIIDYKYNITLKPMPLRKSKYFSEPISSSNYSFGFKVYTNSS